MRVRTWDGLGRASWPRSVAVAAGALILALTGTGCGASTSGVPQAPSHAAGSPTGVATSGVAAAACKAVVVAAGDIVNDVKIADRTGRVAAAQHPDKVLVLGDNQYPSGSLASYRNGYDRISWGQLKPVTKPVPGNHEYRTPHASGYFSYFGNPPAYYAYDVGCGWRGYALNSEINLRAQADWLRRDLAQHPGVPVVAAWHRPRWSSGSHGNNPSVQALWAAFAGRSGVVLNGHEHSYERFAPVGKLRQFVVGTGGRSTYEFGSPVSGSQRRIAHMSGVLRLDLGAGAGYRWRFLDQTGKTQDSGSG